MTVSQILSALGGLLLFLAHLAVLARVLLRPHREPASRIAWLLLIIGLPVLGMVAYLLLGETSIGRRRARRMHEALASMPAAEEVCAVIEHSPRPQIPERYVHLFRGGRSVNGFEAAAGNRGRLLEDSDATINNLVADIDAAKDHVHLLFYIWLPDRNGLKVVEALKRAAIRGVTCRVMADGLGSRLLIKSKHWKALRDGGVRVAVALPIGNLLLRPFHGRIDLRNHRKIVVIDDWITYCGSQNCADPEFRIKPRYAPWVDAMIRFEGPIARQNQYLFVADWMTFVKEDLRPLLQCPLPATVDCVCAQVIGTGPTVRNSAMPEIFESLMYTARRDLFITTPYFVPDEGMLTALCASGHRGIRTTIIFPARNDSWVVQAASRSYYADLLAAGVRIFEFEGGLLHTKSLTLDGEITLIGSANMDRRSFDLNYENNILFYDPALTEEMLRRQHSYLEQSHEVTIEMVARWSITRQLWNNAIATMGPVL